MNVWQLLTTLSAIVVSAVSVVGWAYDKFETKDASRERSQTIESRLARIESKIDHLLERKGN